LRVESKSREGSCLVLYLKPDEAPTMTGPTNDATVDTAIYCQYPSSDKAPVVVPDWTAYNGTVIHTESES